MRQSCTTVTALSLTQTDVLMDAAIERAADEAGGEKVDRYLTLLPPGAELGAFQESCIRSGRGFVGSLFVRFGGR
jgi:hypothetical protein